MCIFVCLYVYIYTSGKSEVRTCCRHPRRVHLDVTDVQDLAPPVARGLELLHHAERERRVSLRGALADHMQAKRRLTRGGRRPESVAPWEVRAAKTPRRYGRGAPLSSSGGSRRARSPR